MSDYEFWKDLGNIFDAILHYQKKNVEFNNRFINPWIRLGNIFDRDDRNKEAVEAYRHAVEIDPDTAQNWSDLGDAHFKTGSYDEAINAYQKAVELDPKAGWPLSNLALTVATQGRHEDAIPLYAMSIDLFAEDKDKAVTWNRLGNLYRKLNDYERAFQSFKQADELDHDNTGFRDQLDDTTETETVIAPQELLDQMIVERPVEDTAQPAADNVALVNVITDEAANAGVIGIVPDIEMVVTEEPAPVAEAEVIVLETAQVTVVADAQVSQDEAVVEIDEMHTDWLPDEAPSVEAVAAESKPADSPAWLNELMTQELVVEDHAVESLATVSDVTMDAVETYTEFVPAHETKAEPLTEPVVQVHTEVTANVVVEAVQPAAEESVPEAATQLEVTDEAEVIVEDVTVIESAVEDQPVAVVNDQTLEAAYEEYLKDSVLPAQSLSDRVDEVHTSEAPETKVSSNGEVRIAMDTRNAHVWNELGNVYLNSGSYEEAIAAYGKALELDRQFAWPYSNLALAYVHKGRFAEAILLYQRSIELFTSDKDKAITWNRLGNVYRRLNDYANAIAAYQTADELDPDNTTLSLRSHYGLLGNLYAEQKTYVS